MFGLGGPKVLEEVKSKYSGTLKVMHGFGYKYVASGILTQSGGLIHDVWAPVFKKIAQKDKSWLILGLATGTAAQMIAKKYQPTKIVGVEIDPEMIRIGKKYFDLNHIPNLEVVVMDAKDYEPNQKFDYVLVDMYQNDQLPKFVYSDKFLKKRLGTTVVFNHLFYEDWMKANAEKMIVKLRGIYKDIKLVRVLTNIMIICQ